MNIIVTEDRIIPVIEGTMQDIPTKAGTIITKGPWATTRSPE